MSNREEPPYDPYIPNGGGAAGGQQGGQNGNHRTAALQARLSDALHWHVRKSTRHNVACFETVAIATPLVRALGQHLDRRAHVRAAQLQLAETCEIDSTVGIMRDNINKVSERGARLDSLQDKTDNLAVSAQGFRRGANRVRKQMWWKDMKMRMCLIVGIIILLIVIIVPSVVATQKK
ncbi:hypothetical protein GGP41_004715 [Bipolaris sorokiniana]|uniref:V-SNARE coiled-coil homology domain-containing protein n=1 Tax=Cochliobolus sativus TaxID=45130 RepID=A0A8H6DUA3_COCSA|nr:hypothetical protein GGP41_004715 [Bipolaris sorokiniana]